MATSPENDDAFQDDDDQNDVDKQVLIDPIKVRVALLSKLLHQIINPLYSATCVKCLGVNVDTNLFMLSMKAKKGKILSSMLSCMYAYQTLRLKI